MVKVPIGEPPVEYDSFISVEDADEYLAADIVRATPWFLRNADNKGRALVSATRMMLTFPWCADPPIATEPQDSPIPEITAMLAADMASRPKIATGGSGNSNIKSAKAGSAQVEFWGPVDGAPPIPQELWSQLIAAGLICPGDGDDGDVGEGFWASGGGCHRPLSGRWPWDWPIAEEDYG